MPARQEAVELAKLGEGDLVRAVAGTEPDAYMYDMLVLNPGELPVVLFTQTGPDGKVVGPSTFRLRGTGHLLTPQQNPVAYPGETTIYHGKLFTGGTICVFTPPDGISAEFFPNCTSFEVYPNNPTNQTT